MITWTIPNEEILCEETISDLLEIAAAISCSRFVAEEGGSVEIRLESLVVNPEDADYHGVKYSKKHLWKYLGSSTSLVM